MAGAGLIANLAKLPLPSQPLACDGSRARRCSCGTGQPRRRAWRRRRPSSAGRARLRTSDERGIVCTMVLEPGVVSMQLGMHGGVHAVLDDHDGMVGVDVMDERVVLPVLLDSNNGLHGFSSGSVQVLGEGDRLPEALNQHEDVKGAVCRAPRPAQPLHSSSQFIPAPAVPRPALLDDQHGRIQLIPVHCLV